jgi:ABC-type transport system involved in multi-copper enzyme maturation permease subunit
MTTATANSTTEHEEPPMTTTQVPLTLAAEGAVATGPPPAGQLTAALRSEWIKSTTVRTTKALLIGALVVSPLMSWATAAFYTDEVLTVAKAFVFSTWLTAVLAAIAGVLSFTSEVQHGTLAGSLTAHPSRWPVAAAKTLLAAGVGLLLGVVGLVTGFLGALAGGIEVGDTSGTPSTVGWALLYTVGSGVLGLGIGMIVRHSAGAVSGILVWWFVIEGLLIQFAPAEVVRYLPFDAGFRTLGAGPSFDSPEFVASALSNPLHAAIFWGYVTAALVLGTALLVRRDAD